MRNHSYENDFDLHEMELHAELVKGFALRLGLKQRHRELGNGQLNAIQFFACTNAIIHLLATENCIIPIVFNFPWDMVMSREI